MTYELLPYLLKFIESESRIYLEYSRNTVITVITVRCVTRILLSISIFVVAFQKHEDFLLWLRKVQLELTNIISRPIPPHLPSSLQDEEDLRFSA